MTSISVSLTNSGTTVHSFWIKSGLKRLFDIVLSFLGLVFLSPVFAVLAVAIVRDTPGPVFFRGRRKGRGGKEFRILKFRTMRADADNEDGPKVTACDDPRITLFGHWLRATKLNELPQLWNVLTGTMSLVGPRPEDPDLARDWPEEVQKCVFAVRPGVTSPASILYRNEESLLRVENLFRKYMFELVPDKMRLDQLYVRYCSFFLDMDVLLWTFLILLPKLGNLELPEKLIFLGPVSRFIRNYVSWFVIDTFIALLAFALTGALWRLSTPLNIGTMRAAIFMAMFSLLFSIASTILGVNHVDWEKATIMDGVDLLVTWLSSTVIICFAAALLVRFPLELVIIASFLSLFGFMIVRYRLRLFIGLLAWILRFQTRPARLRESVLIIGTGQAAQLGAWLLTHPLNHRKFHVAGFIDNDMLKQGMRVYGSKVVGMLSETANLLKKYKVSMVLLASPHDLPDDFPSIASECEKAGARLLVLPDVLATLNQMAQIEPHAAPHGSSCELDGHNCEENPCLRCLIRQTPAVLGPQFTEVGAAGWRGREQG